MRTSEILDLAADEIQRRGWTNQLEVPDGGSAWGRDGKSPVCLEGAIFAVTGWDYPEYEGVTAALRDCPGYKAMHEYLGLFDAEVLWGPRSLWAWNDATGRTAEEVIVALRAAAAVERAKEESLEGTEIKEKLSV